MELLIAALVVACSAAVAGMIAVEDLRRRRRTNVLGRRAHSRHVRFSVEDPFNMPKRYRRFALMNAGHDFCVRNVCDSPSDAGRGRTFDLHFDVGRGRRREHRHYAVAVIELARGAEVDAGRCQACDGRTKGLDVDETPHRGIEHIGRVVLAHAPMGEAPGDHVGVLDRALGAVSGAPNGGVE